MAHELTRIRSRLLNTPLLVEAKTFEGVMEYLDKRVQGGVAVQPNLDKDSSEREFQGLWTIAYPEQSLGLIRIEGPLTNKTTGRSEEHTSELQSRGHIVCRLLLE